jgi:hypothetical protein
VSTTREIQIEDRYGTILHVAHDENGAIVGTIIGDRPTVEIDEADRRELADWLLGARR